MKKKLLGLLIIITVFLAGCSTPVEKIAVMDMGRVLQESQQARQLQQELLEVGERLEEEYNQKEDELAEEEGEEALDEIYQKYLDYKESAEKELNQKINQVLAEISKEEKYNIVITGDGVYYGGNDITDQVINRLDQGITEDGEADRN
ncbi:MAG: OmpH family outer membrane protein [Halanaerobiales bacterium]|nr:OmpH family outer membrane protein [Halanaerobiales bacterium]